MATKPKFTVNELMDSILAVDDDMAEEEAKAELKAAGFDIKKTEASLNNRFEQLRALAKRRKLDEARTAREKQPSFDFMTKVKAMGLTAQELVTEIQKLTMATGSLGAAYRNKGSGEESREELESHLADLLEAEERAKK